MGRPGAQGGEQLKVTSHDVDAHPAPQNMSNTSTLALMHQSRSWLNAEAAMNILRIVVTPEISHSLMSSLKDAAPGQLKQYCPDPQNNFSMFVTPAVSHAAMGP